MTKEIIVDKTAYYIEYDKDYNILRIKVKPIDFFDNQIDVSFLMQPHAMAYFEEEIRNDN